MHKVRIRARRMIGMLFMSAALSLSQLPWLHSSDPNAQKLNPKEAVAHVLQRMAYGGTPKQLAEVQNMTWQKWALQQLDPQSIDNTSLEKRLDGVCPSRTMTLTAIHEHYAVPRKAASTPEERRALQRERNQLRAKLKQELIDAVLLRAIYSPRQFEEVMVDFWRNHLSVDVNKVPYLAVHYEETVLRRHAFGKFDELLMASAKHPAMLVFLDNHVSGYKALNENYARELMELHTLGVDNYYTQTDVVELARVLTGWTCGWRQGNKEERAYQFYFNERTHDRGEATVLGLKLDGKGGMADGEKVIRYLAHHPGTAQFISRKLCCYLVNDEPIPDMVRDVAEVFTSTQGDLKAVYKAILFHPEFMSRRNYKVKFKTPFEFVVSALRATGAQVDATTMLARELRLMGQPLYECDVPTGYSDQAEAWLDPGILVYRWNFAIMLNAGKVNGIKVPASFYEPLVRMPLNERARRVLDLVVPGLPDYSFETTLRRSVDPQAMIALALGSPIFQQQ